MRSDFVKPVTKILVTKVIASNGIAGKNPFGNGDASFKIVEVLLNNLR
ncbi:MAG: hypothetical protein V9E96_09045 [Chitinophagaceae bacterium]